MSHHERLVSSIEEKARQIRLHVLQMIYQAGSGHPGGSLSCAEIIACLYFHQMNVRPGEPSWVNRDRFVLSKGHAAPALYAALAMRGFFPMSELGTLRRPGSILQGHPNMAKTPGVDMSTGSLGQGLSVALGMAIGARWRGLPAGVYVLLGDGELDEGQTWEAAMAAAKSNPGNLVAICDYNGVQLDGTVSEIMPLEPLKDKWKSFGWDVAEVDGHNTLSLLEALDWARENRERPSIILAHTVKGKGVSFMEGQAAWHGRCPTEGEYLVAYKELAGGAPGPSHHTEG